MPLVNNKQFQFDVLAVTVVVCPSTIPPRTSAPFRWPADSIGEEGTALKTVCKHAS